MLYADGTLEVCTDYSGYSCSSNPDREVALLPYGADLAQGPFNCLSKTTGVTCTVTSGQGFTISPKGIIPLGAAGSEKTSTPTTTTRGPAPVSNMGREWFLANLLSTKVYGVRAGMSASTDQKLVDIALSACEAVGGRGDDVAQRVADEMVKQGAVMSQYDADVFVATATTAFCNY